MNTTLPKEATILKNNMPDWMNSSQVNVLHVECDENGVHTISMVKSRGMKPHIVGKYIETDDGIESLHLLPEKVESQLRQYLTDVQIGGCALLAARYFKENPDAVVAEMSITITKECKHKGSEMTICIPKVFEDVDK
jgi:hypothetical protein